MASVSDSIHNRNLTTDGFASRLKKAQELRHPFYSLTDDAKQVFQNELYVITVPLEENADRYDDQGNATTPPRRTQLAANSSAPDTPFLAAEMLARLTLSQDDSMSDTS